MLDLYRNIRMRREALGLTQTQLAELSGYADKTMISKIEAIAAALKTTPRALMGWDDSIHPYPNIHPVTTRRFPVLGSVSCGEPKLMDEEIDVSVDASEEIKADFVLRAKGDSMIGARINDGDLVFVRKQDIVENGEIAVVAIDDEATLKRFYKYDELIVLRAENPAYKEYRPEQAHEIRVLGKAVSFQSKIK